MWIASYIADGLGYKLEILTKRNPNQTPFFTQNNSTDIIHPVKSILLPSKLTKEWLDPYISFLKENTENISLHIIEDFHEDSELVFSYKEYIKSIYTFPILSGNSRITIHARLDDLARFYINYYESYARYINTILDKYPSLPVYIVTANGDHNLIKKTQSILSRNSTVVSGNHLDDFDFLRSSTIIISASTTFAWWAYFFNSSLEKYYVFLTPHQNVRNDSILYKNLPNTELYYDS